MAKTYRVGIIGREGKGGYGHEVDVAFTKLENVEIVAVADEDATGRAAAQERTKARVVYADYHEMLAKETLDMVAICPRWIDQHHAMLVAAAEAGCHVYMEKPFCRTLEECDAIVTQFDMRHLKLNLAHVTQFSPVLDTVLKLMRDGLIGEILELRGRGKEDRRGGGEDLWVLGSHVFGLMRSLAGGQPVGCSAQVHQSGHPVTRADVFEGAEGIGPLAGDHLQASFQFSNQVTGYFASRKGMESNPSRFAVQVFGSKGILEMETGYLKPAYVLRDGSWSPGRSGKMWEKISSAGIDKAEPITDGTYVDGHVAGIRDLISAIENHEPTRCGTEEGRDIVEMIAAVFESHRQQKPVTLPLTTRVNPLTRLS